MKCPFCNASDTKVIDSRPADDNSSIRRRRQCEQCGRRFTTYEKLETMPLMVIKKDDSRETYDRSKLEKGILLSCHKRPVSSQEISTMIDGIENQIFNMGEREIPASLIGELVMKKLKDVDEGEKSNQITLRDGSDEINKELEARIDERLAMAGIEVVEARINYLAYAPEIAAVMLRRQQASAIISAREKIVEGAVSMVKMALQKLSDEDVVELDDDKKAAMVSNLLVVLCGDDTAQPVVNTGTLNH